ncbi:MAG: peptide-binding protein [Nitrospirota bacterium]|nr:peptide-binding protein [Nitrospirota bacterium]
MKSLRITVSLLAFACLALAGCSKSEPTAPAVTGAASGPPVTGDWLVRHMLSDPEQLNPITSNDAGASSVLSYLFETLLDRNPVTLELRPLLAAALPEISADHTTYTFRLREGARFSDGKPVTAEDVLFSIKAIKCQQVNAPFVRVYYQSITDAVLLDDQTIRFTASEPYFKNEDMLGGISILPRHYYDPEGHLNGVSVRQLADDDPAVRERAAAFAETFNRDFFRNPVGSGPYVFNEWKTGEKVVLDRNPDYWGYAFPEIESPYVDRMLFRIINNPDSALVTLKGGDLDMLGLDPLQHLRQTSGARFEENFAKIRYYSPGYTYLGWNNDHPIFGDPRVRRAMTMLTDRAGMVKSILHDLGTVINGPIYKFRPEYDDTIQPYPFDPDGAAKLLAEAGWKDTDGDGLLDKEIDGRRTPLSFEIKTNSGNDVRKRVALAVQDSMQRHGIEVKIREVDWTIFLDEVKNRRFDAIILGWAMGVTEPDGYQIWHSSQIENRGSNHIAFRNSRVDAILEAYRGEFDPQKRTAMYREFQRILHEEQPYTFLFMGESVVAYHKRFENVEALPIGGVVPTRWWVPKERQRYVTETPAP